MRFFRPRALEKGALSTYEMRGRAGRIETRRAISPSLFHFLLVPKEEIDKQYQLGQERVSGLVHRRVARGEQTHHGSLESACNQDALPIRAAHVSSHSVLMSGCFSRSCLTMACARSGSKIM